MGDNDPSSAMEPEAMALDAAGEGEAVDVDSLSPEAKLAEQCKSRPAVDLLPGLPLSPLVNTALLPAEAKALLAETWMKEASEEAPPPTDEDAPPPPAPSSFDPSAPEYNVMMRRVAKSAPLAKWNEATLKVKETEDALAATKDEKEIEALSAELEAAKAAVADADAALGELKASFADDPTSLTPWMCTLFDLVDAGLSTFEVGGAFFPHTNLTALFGSDNTTGLYDDAERVLGAFKRRCDRERGEGAVQLLARIVPNIFQDGYKPDLLEPLVDKMRANLYGEESSAPLDFLQLFWWDPASRDVLPTLKALQKLAEDKLEVNEETGEASVSEPRKVRGLGLVDFPARGVLAAIQAGVPVAAVQLPFSVADRSGAEALAVARKYGLKVLARGGLMGGVISEKFVGAECPDSARADAELDDVADALDQINDYGGWGKVQGLLRTVQGIARKHGVAMQAVALRWQIDQGTFPLVPMRWGRGAWRQFGKFYAGGTTLGQDKDRNALGHDSVVQMDAVDKQLFQVDSFLDMEDMQALNALAA